MNFIAAPPARPARPPASPTPIRPPPPSLSNSPFQRRKDEKIKNKNEEKEEEEDPWAKFNQMSTNVSNIVKNTKKQLKNLSENSTADTIQDESYLAQIG